MSVFTNRKELKQIRKSIILVISRHCFASSNVIYAQREICQ